MQVVRHHVQEGAALAEVSDVTALPAPVAPPAEHSSSELLPTSAAHRLQGGTALTVKPVSWICGGTWRREEKRAGGRWLSHFTVIRE